ncbi:MAG TPA: MFS transporter [Caulobacteraceae bacterium]
MTAAWRLALNYALVFGGNGVALPFIGLWLRAQGLSGAEIGVVLATPMLARLITGPAIALWADGFHHRRTAMAILAAVAAAGYALLLAVEGLALWLPVWFVAATAAAALIPLSDVLTLKVAARDGYAFSWPRGAGSAAFVAANVAMGAMLARVPVDAIVIWLVAAAALAALVAGLVLPAERVHDEGGVSRADRFRGLGRLVADPTFMTAITAVGLIQSAHAFYYGFSALEWRARGISAQTTGLLWAVSVVAEIAFLWVIDPWRLRRGIGPWTLLMIGGVAAAWRWAALALAPPVWLLWPLQGLHALSFAATFLAGLQIVERLCPPQSATGGQMLVSTLSSGVLVGLATLLSGPLYDAYGAGGYVAMTLMCLGGLALAWRVRAAVA